MDVNLYRYVWNQPIIFIDPFGNVSALGVAGTVALGYGAATANIPLMGVGTLMIAADIYFSYEGGKKQGKSAGEKIREKKKKQYGEIAK